MQPIASEPNWSEILIPSVTLITQLVDEQAQDEYSLDRIARNRDYLVKHSDKVSGEVLAQVEAGIAKANTHLS